MLAGGDTAVLSFLRQSAIVHVATLSPKERPFATPLWFVVHDNDVYITSSYDSWAGRNVRQHPQVTLLFCSDPPGHSDLTLRVRGTATCHRGFPPWPALLRIAMKYELAPRALWSELRHVHKWRLRARYYRQAKGGPGYIRVVPSAYEFLPPP